MSQQSVTQTGRQKNRSARLKSNDLAGDRARSAARDQRDRLEQDRMRRQQQHELENGAILAILVYRSERAKAIAAGKAVTPTLEEWRSKHRINATAIGDQA